jgi:predicted outer membrane repeat protein
MKKRIRKSFRPTLEGLETRLVPAQIIKVTTLDDVVNPADKVLSLREAITLANASPGADTIQLTLSGTYKMKIAGSDNTNNLGDYDITDSVSIVGLGATKTIIESNNGGASTERLFDLLGKINVTFANLTMQKAGNGGSDGGAVQALTANITMSNCVVTGNTGRNGAAINAGTGNVTLTNTTLSNNNPTIVFVGVAGNGGAINAGSGTVTLTDCRLNNNTAVNGGAIFDQSGNVVLTRCTLDHNSATENGGAVDVLGGALTMKDSLVRLNVAGQLGAGADTAGDLGGGIFAKDATVSGSTLSANTAFLEGGAIFVTNGLTMTNSTVSGNSATRSGGGISAIAGVNLTGSTVSGNRAFSDIGFGGGIDATGVVMSSCTVRGNAGGFGGGVNGAFINLTNTTVSGNVATTSGGGIRAGTSATLTGSTVSGNTAATGDGGGIFCPGTATLSTTTVSGNNSATGAGGLAAITAKLTTCTVTGNQTRGFGGGISVQSATLATSTVSGNVATTSGGGIFASTSVTLTGSTVNGNTSATGDGGGIFCPGTVTLSATTIAANNSATSAGGVAAGTASLTACTVTANHTRGFGGGVSSVNTTLVASTVSENTADGDGGGVLALQTLTADRSLVSDNLCGKNGGGINAVTVKLTYTTVSSNSSGVGHGFAGSTGFGGGVYASHGSILNCTIAENFATSFGGGVESAVSSGGDFMHVKNTIIADNMTQTLAGAPDADGGFISEGHNLIGVIDFSTGFSNALGDQFGFASAPLDPLLGPLQNNGGPTKTHALLAGSPAIDHGDNDGAPATDQRGVARARDGDGNGSKIVDIGAFEK